MMQYINNYHYWRGTNYEPCRSFGGHWMNGSNSGLWFEEGAWSNGSGVPYLGSLGSPHVIVERLSLLRIQWKYMWILY